MASRYARAQVRMVGIGVSSALDLLVILFDRPNGAALAGVVRGRIGLEHLERTSTPHDRQT